MPCCNDGDAVLCREKGVNIFRVCGGITPDWLFEIGGNRFVAVVVKPLVSLSRFRNITK